MRIILCFASLGRVSLKTTAVKGGGGSRVNSQIFEFLVLSERTLYDGSKMGSATPQVTFFIISVNKLGKITRESVRLCTYFGRILTKMIKTVKNLSNATPPPQMIQCSPNLVYSMPLC